MRNGAFWWLRFSLYIMLKTNTQLRTFVGSVLRCWGRGCSLNVWWQKRSAPSAFPLTHSELETRTALRACNVVMRDLFTDFVQRRNGNQISDWNQKCNCVQNDSLHRSVTKQCTVLPAHRPWGSVELVTQWCFFLFSDNLMSVFPPPHYSGNI